MMMVPRCPPAGSSPSTRGPMNHGMCRSSQSRSLIGDFFRAGASFLISNLKIAFVAGFGLDFRPVFVPTGVGATAFSGFPVVATFFLLMIVLSMGQAPTFFRDATNHIDWNTILDLFHSFLRNKRQSDRPVTIPLLATWPTQQSRRP